MLFTLLLGCPEPLGQGSSRDLAAMQASIRGLEGRLAALEAQAAPDAPPDADVYLRLDALDDLHLGDRIQALEDATAASVMLVDADIAVADCDGLRSELDRLQTVRFGAGVGVTLLVAPGVHRCAGPVTVAHPQGAQISILGNVTNPAAVELRFGGDGLVVGDGTSLGLVDGLRLTAITPGVGTGVLVKSNATLRVGAHLLVEQFATGNSP
jgi:hypothetical protein